MIILGVVLFVVLVIGQYALWLYADTKRIEKEQESDSLKEAIVEIIGKLKPKQNIFIHYGNEKQLSFINGELQ